MSIMSEETKQPVQQPKDDKPSADNISHQEHKKEKLHKLHEHIDKLQAEKDELFAKLQRLSADYINYQKRSAKQVSESIAYEKEVLIKSLLPVLDNFEHTLSGAENTGDMEGLRKGVKIIYDQILSILKNYGVEQIDSVGQEFDPSYHQAVMQETDADKEDGIILKELVKGYRLGDKVLRPSRVVVNKKPVDEEGLTEQQKTIESDEDYFDEDRE
jgi:molecular chaperone GrpE